MTHERPPPLAACQDETLFVEAAEQQAKTAADASHAMADRAALLRKGSPEADERDDFVKVPVALREDLPLTVAGAEKIRQLLNDAAHDDFDHAQKVCAAHPEICDPKRARAKVEMTPITDMKSNVWVTMLE